MASIGHGLMIKFGLAHQPSPERADEWARSTRELIRQGLSQELAEEQATKRL